MNRRVTGLILVGLGAAFSLLLIGSAPMEPTSAIVSTGPFLLIAATVAFVGAWLWIQDDPVGSFGNQILAWTAGGAVTFGSIGYLLAIGLPAPPGQSGMFQVVLQAGAAGSVAGIAVGLYDAKSRHRFQELEAERDRVEQFARKAKSLNAYGKALYESQDVHDVSALSMEVLELLIGSHESAVIEVGTETRILDSTIPSAHTEFLFDVAGAVENRPSMETVRVPEDLERALPSELNGEEVLAVPIGAAEKTVVLVSVVDSEDAYTEEDLDLLGTLSSHVGTALLSLDKSAVSAT